MEQSTTSAKDKKLPGTYQNNPFYVATDGLDRLFKKAQSVGIFLAILCALSLFSSPSSFIPGNSDSKNTSTAQQNNDFTNWIGSIPTEVWITVGVVGLFAVLFFIAIGIVLKGIGDYTAAHIAKGETVTLGQAFKGVFSQFWGYTWVLVIAGVKTFLWTLLFIIPGIIMAIRYSLAGVSFFDTDKRGNAAIKDSLALTKGAILTTFASHALFSIITFGLISNLLEPGTNSVLYGQYRTLTDKGLDKPKSHLLSKLTLILLLVGILVALLLLAALLYAAANYMSTSP